MALNRVVVECVSYTPTISHQKDLAIQAKAPYDDVELTNCGYQLEWFQALKGEKPIYKTPPFHKTW